MPTITTLRALVISEVVLLTAAVLTIFLPTETIPAIDEYLQGPGAGPLLRLLFDDETMIMYFAAVALVFTVIYVVALVGVLLLKPWSRRLYAITFLAGVCLRPLFGTTLVDPISGTIEYLAAACSGAILATLYLSDAKAIFDVRTPDQLNR